MNNISQHLEAFLLLLIIYIYFIIKYVFNKPNPISDDEVTTLLTFLLATCALAKPWRVVLYRIKLQM